MTTALRRSSVALAVMLLLVFAQVQAAAPLALFAKQIVKQIVRDFVESQITSLVRQSLGPCKSMLVDMARAGAVPGLPAVPGDGAVPGMGSVPGMGAMPTMDPAMQAKIQQMMSSNAVMPGGQAMDPAMAAQMQQMLAGMQTRPAALRLSRWTSSSTGWSCFRKRCPT